MKLQILFWAKIIRIETYLQVLLLTGFSNKLNIEDELKKK